MKYWFALFLVFSVVAFAELSLDKITMKGNCSGCSLSTASGNASVKTSYSGTTGYTTFTLRNEVTQTTTISEQSTGAKINRRLIFPSGMPAQMTDFVEPKSQYTCVLFDPKLAHDTTSAPTRPPCPAGYRTVSAEEASSNTGTYFSAP